MSEQPKTPETQGHQQDIRRNALLRYIVIMFAVALVLVLLSMVLQNQNNNETITNLHQSSTSALTRAEALQNANRELEEKLKLQQGTTDALQAQLNAVAEEKAAAVEENKNLRAAYDALTIVLLGEEKAESPEAYAAAVDTVNTMKSYLSPEAAALYDAYMEDKQ